MNPNKKNKKSKKTKKIKTPPNNSTKESEKAIAEKSQNSKLKTMDKANTK